MPDDTGLYFWRGDDELVLFVGGRVTATEAYTLYHHLESWLTDHPEGTVYLDLDGTRYIDSTTIGTFIRLHKQRLERGGALYLCNLSHQVAEVIRQTKLTRYFRIIENASLREFDQSVLRALPTHADTSLDASFVLDAHNDICAVRPELESTFSGLLTVLRAQVDSERGNGQ